MEEKFGKICKEHMIRELSDKLSLRPNMLVADFSRLSVDKLIQLRKDLRFKDSRLFVIKKSIAKRALKQSDMEEVIGLMQGTAGFVFCKDDPIAVSKIIFDFAKENQSLNVLGGFLDGKVVDGAKIKQISRLPSRQIILQQLLSSMNWPIYGFVNALSANIKGIINIVSQIKDKKEK